uniref:Putative F-box protein At1g60180 n=1 Tax=Anthurium amnicola TaxID=1678845 RepID=A0A1D1YCD1_9ARAE
MAAADGSSAAAAASTIEDLHPDVLTGVLRLLGGPDLAAASCATSHLRALATQPHLWEALCLSAWPSLRLLPSSPASYRSLFSDAHTFPHPAAGARTAAGAPKPPPLLISAVDLLHGGKPVFSSVVETDAQGPWFLCSPFRVDALGREDHPPSPAPVISTGDLYLSWVLIDPANHRAVNLSSRRPVSLERLWYVGEIQARFAVVLDGGRAAATVLVTWEEETRQLREVTLVVEDVDGTCLNGKESLAILHGALKGERKGGEGKGEADARRRYTEYVARKRERKERALTQEGWLDMCCIALGISLFLAFLVFVALR